MAPQPNSPDNSSDAPFLIGAITGTNPDARDGVHDDQASPWPGLTSNPNPTTPPATNTAPPPAAPPSTPTHDESPSLWPGIGGTNSPATSPATPSTPSQTATLGHGDQPSLWPGITSHPDPTPHHHPATTDDGMGGLGVLYPGITGDNNQPDPQTPDPANDGIGGMSALWPGLHDGSSHDPFPAYKTRIGDGLDGKPCYAILNGAGQYLFTVDAHGNRIEPLPGATGNTAGNGSTTTGLMIGALPAATEAGAEAATAAGTAAGLAADVEAGGILGSTLGPVGTAAGLAVGALAWAGAAYLGYQAAFPDTKHPTTGNHQSGNDTGPLLDPGQLPNYPGPQAPNNSAQTTTATTTTTDPGVTQSTQSTQGGATNDPNTVHDPIGFKSWKPGQKNVPVQGTYWEGGNLKWAPGNPYGKKPHDYARNPDKKSVDPDLYAVLHKLGIWNLKDIPAEHLPAVLDALVAYEAAGRDKQARKDWIWFLAQIFGANPNELIASSARLRAEIGKLNGRGLPAGFNVKMLTDAVTNWRAAGQAERDAGENLGEVSAIAILEGQGWTVNRRDKGSGNHDVVAVKNGFLLVVEAKGGKSGFTLTNSNVPTSAGSTQNIYSTQMTDPYFWGKLKEDADNDPAFEGWLKEHGVWQTVVDEDAANAAYRLAATNPQGQTTIYGADQKRRTGAVIPPDVTTGKTTGTRPPAGQKLGPTLGVTLPPAQPTAFVAPSNPTPLDAILTRASNWIDDLFRGRPRGIAAISQLAAPIAPVPALQPGLWPRRKTADQSLTVTITQRKPARQSMIDAERLKCLTYL